MKTLVNLEGLHQLTRRQLEEQADSLLKRLFPICRSLTGKGVRESLSILREIAAFDMHELASGTACYDWAVPDEWNISEAYIADMASGRRIIDFKDNNLHVVSYSSPVDATLSFEELKPHLHSLAYLPDAIPYRTSYYKKDWGFCLTHEQLRRIDVSARYRVRIDSSLAPGNMTFGDRVLPGSSGCEFLVSTYCCHPSLANDNLSGIVLWAMLLGLLQQRKLRHSYRFIIVPETIGAIAYLSQHESAMKRLDGGFVITTVAGPGPFGYKQTFTGNHLIDRAVQQAFRDLKLDHVPYPFDIKGSDETHYGSPHFRIPTGTICKDKYYEYPFYHTSRDDLSFIRARYLVDTLHVYLAAIDNLELNGAYKSLHPFSEPMLGKRGLYPQLGGAINQPACEAQQDQPQADHEDGKGSLADGRGLDAILWLMFLGDGKISLLDIAERTGLPMRLLHRMAAILCEQRLLRLVKTGGKAP